MGYNPSALTDCGADCPVETVSWYEAAAYTNAVSAAAGLTECYACTGAGSDVVCDVAVDPYDCEGYRLLTEAEWEGAARCGTDVTYAGSNDVSAVAWTSANSGGTKHAVGGLDSNACGLRDLSGNVWEWTGDYYGEYGSAPATDPAGPATGSGRVIRGGGFGGGAADARVAERAGRYGEYGYDALGFRLGRTDP